MKRLTTKIKNKIQKLSIKGYSLNKLSSKLGLSKTTIYYHVRKIKGKRFFPIQVRTDNDEKIGEFIGLFAGDGHYSFDNDYEHRIKISLSENEELVINHYVSVFEYLFGKKPRLYHNKKVITLEIISRNVIDFIKMYLKWGKKKTRSIHLLTTNKLSENFIKGFIRGLIDSDGYVRKGRKEIYFGTISTKLLENFILCIKYFDFKFKVYYQKRPNHSKFYKVRLTGDEVSRFCKIIKPIKSYGLAGI